MYIRKRDIELVRREYGHLKHMMFQNKSDSETFVKFVFAEIALELYNAAHTFIRVTGNLLLVI